MIKKVIPYGKQHINEDDITAVVNVLKGDFLTQGPKVKEFEIAFAKYVGAKYAVAVSNGTAALHLNTIALDVKKGQKVITSPITFAASANCVRYCGGEVVFADIDPDTYLLDFDKVEELLRNDLDNEIVGIIPVDFAGRCVELDKFRNLADRYKCWIIEDACHAPGGYFNDRENKKNRAGSGAYADLAIFSFHPVKHIAAGEGGMITTNSEEHYQKLLNLRTHGITKNNDEFSNPVDLAIGESQHLTLNTEHYPVWYMEMQTLGYNYRLSDINCALGLSQLNRANEGLEKRRVLANKYRNAFKSIKHIEDRNIEADTVDNGHAFHLYVIEVEDRLGLYNYLRESGIYAQIHYIPCHLMPYYMNRGWKEGDLPFAEKYYSKCLSLPLYPTLSTEEQEYVIEKIKEFYSE